MKTKDLKNDWRLMNQEKYLKNKKLKYHRYIKPSDIWNHDHCKFCSKKIMENCEGVDYCVTTGYSTLDNYYWICEECFDDFKEMFQWAVIDE